MERHRGQRYPDIARTRIIVRQGKRWPYAVGALLLLLAAFWLFGRDTMWELRSREAKIRGEAAEFNNLPDIARINYESALASNPYDWETHLALAGILHHWLNDQDNAHRHYLYAMAYCPDDSVADEIGRTETIVRLMREGEIENPMDAVEDMFQAVEADAYRVFYHRLTPELNLYFDLFWHGWKSRGRGRIFYQNITLEDDGGYNAAVEIRFSDGTDLCARFRSRRHDIWRMSLSFP
ncbi:MAG: hypothetical protein LIP23_07575 [Planctomycetes bacterium]|nr:hypothetical protein [Planctomycetota bacterium]